MDYQTFKQQLAEGKEFPKDEYYQLIVKHASDIMMDIGLNSQKSVAKQLGMTQIKLSHIVNVLRAIHQLETNSLSD